MFTVQWSVRVTLDSVSRHKKLNDANLALHVDYLSAKKDPMHSKEKMLKSLYSDGHFIVKFLTMLVHVQIELGHSPHVAAQIVFFRVSTSAHSFPFGR